MTWQESRPPFDTHFTGATMRVDYFHTGGPAPGETIALDRVVNDGDWPGSRTQLIDTTNLGKYRFEVRDRRLVNTKTGEAMAVEFLNEQPDFERVPMR